jgi:hypothetical protein
MIRRSELYGALLAAGLALVAGRFAGQTALVPCGLAAGLAVGLDDDVGPGGPAALYGARSGALGALAFVVVTAAVGFARLAPIVGPAFAVDWSLFTGFAMSALLLPLYAVEGAAAPLFARGRRFAARSVGSRGG